MRTAANRKYKPGNYKYKPVGRYKTKAELFRSPEWKAYTRAWEKKHNHLMKRNYSHMTDKQLKREARMS